MKGVEIFNGNWSLDDVINNPNKIFVYGDNNARFGKGGQAIIRDLENTIGLRTKKGPNNRSVAFYNDSEFTSNCKKIFDDVIDIKSKLVSGYNIVFSNGGYGTGLANLKEKAPNTFIYLCDLLRIYFEFDNETGKKWTKIPSYNDIVSGVYIDIDKSNEDLLTPTNNSLFRDDLLSVGITNYYDLIRFEKKVAFTSKVSYSKDQILLLSFLNKKDYLVVRVCNDSHDIESIGFENWSIFEGFNIDYIDSIKDISQYKQTHFQFICSLSENGDMVFKDDVFKNTDFDKKKDFKIIGDPFLIENDEINDEINNEFNMDDSFEDVKNDVVNENLNNSGDINSVNLEMLKKLDDISKKLDVLNKKKYFRNPFRKTLEEMLDKKGLNGEIVKIPVLYSDIHLGYLPKYQVKVDDIYYVVGFNDWFLFTTINIILVSKTPLVV